MSSEATASTNNENDTSKTVIKDADLFVREDTNIANDEVETSTPQQTTDQSTSSDAAADQDLTKRDGAALTDEPQTSRSVTAATEAEDDETLENEPQSGESDWPLREKFGIDGKVHEVELNERRLLWWPASQTKSDKATRVVRAVETEKKVLVTNIFSAKSRNRIVQTSKGPLMVPAGYTVFYVSKKKEPKWREKRVHFDHEDVDACRRWAAQVEILAKGSTRPRMLKIFINPAAGKKKGIKIFEQAVASILKICDIRWDITVTERPGHLSELIQQIDLDSYDGLAVVGGDGTVNELIDGLLKSTCLGATPDRVSSCETRIAIIPAGSNNHIATTLYGIADPETSALHIVMGKSRTIDILSMAHRNKPVRFGVSCGYGFPADFIVQSKKHGWFNKAGVPSLHAVKQHRLYPCQVHFLLVDEQKEGDKAGQFKVAEWKVVKGSISAVVVSALKMASDAHPDGLWPEVQDDDGYGRLVIVEECSRSEVLKYHKCLSKSRKRPEDLGFVNSYKVRAVRLRPLQKDPSRGTSPIKESKVVDPSDSKTANDIQDTSKESAPKVNTDETCKEASPPVPSIVVDEQENQTHPNDTNQSHEQEPKANDKTVGSEIEEIGKTKQQVFLNPSPQPQRQRRGFSFSLRQRLRTFSPGRATRATTKVPKKKVSLEVFSTAAGDTLVRRSGVRASSPLPPGGPPADYDDADVDPEVTSPWVVDGDLIREPFVDIRIHNNLISVFVSEADRARENSPLD